MAVGRRWHRLGVVLPVPQISRYRAVMYSGELFRGGIRGMKCGATGQMIGLGRGDRGVVGCEDRVELEGDLFPELVTGDGEV
jgi:hypothetical protein